MNYEIVAKAFGVILFAICSAWGGYLTTTVMDLSKEIDEMQDTRESLRKFRDWNIKQEDWLKRLDHRIDEQCQKPG